jgi:NAD-dependent deacetylase sirtuin 4
LSPRPVRGPADVRRDVDRLLSFLGGKATMVLSGAGCSTESGIPDYRGPRLSSPRRQPMRYQEFMRDPSARARYWARSAVGWSRIDRARPNATHRALAQLELEGWIGGVVTQNVDGLHQAAGTRNLIELHGSLADVRCTLCRRVEPRRSLQRRLEALNPVVSSMTWRFAPDGDAEVDGAVEREFSVPGCEECGGVLKPDVVFFGESVPRDRVAEGWRLYEASDALLVLGSSLAVFSGRRFVLRAVKEERPVAIVNLGSTRCDESASLKIDRRLGDVMPRLIDALIDGSAA